MKNVVTVNADSIEMIDEVVVIKSHGSKGVTESECVRNSKRF